MTALNIFDETNAAIGCSPMRTMTMTLDNVFTWIKFLAKFSFRHNGNSVVFSSGIRRKGLDVAAILLLLGSVPSPI